MKNSNDKTPQSDAVSKVAEKLHIKANDVWNIFFDSGANFLETLKIRIRHKRTFDLQFRFMLEKPGFGELNPTRVFSAIQNAAEYWDWWAAQMYFACRDGNGVYDRTSLLYALNFTEITIPGFILNKIFYGKQKHDGQPRIETTASGKTENTGAKVTGIGAKAGSRV